VSLRLRRGNFRSGSMAALESPTIPTTGHCEEAHRGRRSHRKIRGVASAFGLARTVIARARYKPTAGRRIGQRVTSAFAWAGAAWAALGIVAWAGPAAEAQDRFEIQVYDAETAPPLGTGVELHLNYVAAGTTQVSADGELPTNGVTHATVEPHLGLTTWSEVGMYLQGAVLPAGSVRYAGIKLRYKAKWPQRLLDGLLGLALNLELSAVPAAFEANVYASEIRPIVDLTWGRLYAAINPIIDIDLAGSLAGKPQLQPAAKVSLAAIAGLRFGFEYYTGFGPITGLYPFSQETHLLYLVVDFARPVTDKLGFDASAGVGYNLTNNGERWVINLNAEFGE
jgi:hypothetical protein